ncbi:peroxidase 71-like [Euphorbia lathyris]|uniref:peroxidase 71-like n=1 Tax=Euphorbia lathyris TaxID=212925 RepID=UPI003313DCD0
MNMAYTLSLFVIVLILICSPAEGQGTRVGFYATTCPRAEAIVRSAVQAQLTSNPEIAPGLLRMHFHDCFVQGCDGSVLIDGPNTEKSAVQNSGLNGYNVIDNAKSQLEAACPGIVSCADILALAARDSVVLTSGRTWQVPTGRRDGQISLQSEASTLPGFRTSVADQTKLFTDRGLNTQDLVALVGGHTIGTTSCALFSYRLYNTTTSVSDPSINSAFLPQLQTLCPQGGNGGTRVALDTGSQNRFDSSYFTNLINGRGILESDQILWTDASTRPFVQRFAGVAGNFNGEFARSMVKMSNIGVKTGTQGEIRRLCSAIN